MRALQCVVRLALIAPLADALLAPRRTSALTNAARVARSRRGTALAAAPVAGASSKVLAAATGAVSRLVVTTAVGAATVKANIVTPEQINGLAKVVYNFFLPCFLFTTLIRTVATYGLSPELLLLMPFAVFSLSMFMSSLHNMQEADKMGADKTLRERLGDLKEVTYSPLSHGTSHCP